ncbi:MAG: hypothetical protein JST00_27370 [Deltaproteobacteria bacterium]|nr:hypothetical protein [Deltaproteobacteria bacterium]
MRTALILAALGTFAVSLAACGDASTSAGTTRTRPPSQLGGGVDDGQDDSDQDTPDQGNPNANTPPPPPSGTGTTTGQLGLTLSTATPAAGLGDKVELTVNVEPKQGFTGNAELAVTGLPAGVTAAFAPTAANITGTAPVAVKLTLTVGLTAIPTAAGQSSALTITAKQGAINATVPANFKVNPTAKLTIPMNIDALRTTGTKFLDQWGKEFGAAPVALKTQTGNPIVFTVFNADSKAHIVHGNNGFTHGSTTAGQEVQPNAFEMLNGAPRTRSLPPGANVNGYPHEGANGQSAGFQIQVQAAP